MLLIIHNLPPQFNSKDIRLFIEKKCGIHSFILDNLITENQSLRVTVGLPDEHHAHILKNNINRIMINGHQLFVTDVRKKLVSPQQHRNAQDQLKHPFNDDFSYNEHEHYMHNANHMQSADDALMPLNPVKQGPISAKPTFQGMDIYNQQDDQARFVNQSKFFGSKPNQSNEELHRQQHIPYHQTSNYNMNYSSYRHSDRDRSNRSDHRYLDRRSSDHNDRHYLDRSRSPQKPITSKEPGDSDDYSHYRRDVKYCNDFNKRNHNSPPILSDSINAPYKYAQPNKNYTETQFIENTNCVKSASSYRPNQTSIHSYAPEKQTEKIKKQSSAPHTSFEEESCIRNSKFQNESLSKNLTAFNPNFVGKPTDTRLNGPQVIQQHNVYNRGNVPKMIPPPETNVYNQGNVPKMVSPPEPNVYMQGNVPKIVSPPELNVYNQGNVPKMVSRPETNVYNQGNVSKMIPPPEPNIYNQGNVPKMVSPPEPNVYNQGNVPKVISPPEPNIYNQGNVPKMVSPPEPNVYNQGNVPKVISPPEPNVCTQGNLPEMAENSNVGDQNSIQVFDEMCALATAEIINGITLNIDEEPEEYRKMFMQMLNNLIWKSVIISCNNKIITSKDAIIAKYHKRYPAKGFAKRLKNLVVKVRYEYNLQSVGALKEGDMLNSMTDDPTSKSSTELIAIQKELRETLVTQAKQTMNSIRTMKSMGLSYLIDAELSYLECVGIDIKDIAKLDTLSLYLAVANPLYVTEIHANTEYPAHEKLEAYLRPFQVLGIRKFLVTNTYLAALKTMTDIKRLYRFKTITVDNKKLRVRQFLPSEFVSLNKTSKIVKIRYYAPNSAHKKDEHQCNTLDLHADLLGIEVTKINRDRAKNKLERKFLRRENKFAKRQVKENSQPHFRGFNQHVPADNINKSQGNITEIENELANTQECSTRVQGFNQHVPADNINKSQGNITEIENELANTQECSMRVQGFNQHIPADNINKSQVNITEMENKLARKQAWLTRSQGFNKHATTAGKLTKSQKRIARMEKILAGNEHVKPNKPTKSEKRRARMEKKLAREQQCSTSFQGFNQHVTTETVNMTNFNYPTNNQNARNNPYGNIYTSTDRVMYTNVRAPEPQMRHEFYNDYN